MQKEVLRQLRTWHDLNHDRTIDGRWLRPNKVVAGLTALPQSFRKDKLGLSFEGRSISSVRVGSGSKKILIWSQMHGDESTGTRAIFDLLQLLNASIVKMQQQDSALNEITEQLRQLLADYELVLLPMLNPDGSERYTRVNAQGVDLNRDVLDRSAPETAILLDLLKSLNPEYCFNLHDQRTIFTVGHPPKTATISFLAPSEGPDRSLTEGRAKTMRLIAEMYHYIAPYLKGCIGRYTDEFYPTATGDNFQKMGYSTVLVESGHFPNDYDRKEARFYTFSALLGGLLSLVRGVNEGGLETYAKIPENEKYFLDVILRGVMLEGEYKDVGLQFKAQIEDDGLIWNPEIEKTGDLSAYSANFDLEDQGLDFDSKAGLLSFVQNSDNLNINA